MTYTTAALSPLRGFHHPDRLHLCTRNPCVPHIESIMSQDQSLAQIDPLWLVKKGLLTVFEAQSWRGGRSSEGGCQNRKSYSRSSDIATMGIFLLAAPSHECNQIRTRVSHENNGMRLSKKLLRISTAKLDCLSWWKVERKAY